MNIGERISLTRKCKGIQQKYVAEKLYKTPQWLSNIERGTRPVGAEELKKIATILGVDAGIFFADDFNNALSKVLSAEKKGKNLTGKEAVL